jgi:hypothetical protein
MNDLKTKQARPGTPSRRAPVTLAVAALALLGTADGVSAQSFTRCLDAHGTAIYATQGSQTACATGPEARVMIPVRPPTREEQLHTLRLASIAVQAEAMACDREARSLVAARGGDEKAWRSAPPAELRIRCAAVETALRGIQRDMAQLGVKTN